MNITASILVSLYSVFLAFAFWSAGSLLARGNLHSIRITAGMAVFAFVGGVINAIGLATGPVLLGVLLTAACAGLLQVASNRPSISRIALETQPVAIACVLILLGSFVASSDLWPTSFNHFDDYQKYFTHVVKMLETGSSYGSALSTMGLETLGGQALFQALFVYPFGIEAINAFDALFCLLLAAFILLELAWRIDRLAVGVACVLLLVVIHRQYVNVTSSYSLVLMSIAAVVIQWQMLGRNGESPLRHLLLLGLVYATTISLKSNNGILAIAHFPLVVASLFAQRMPLSTVLRQAALATAGGMMAILPWLSRPLGMIVSNGWLSYESTYGPYLTKKYGLELLLSKVDLFWGARPIDYGLVIALLLAFCAVSIFRHRKNILGSPQGLVAALSAAATLMVITFFYIVVLGDDTLDHELVIRYLVPFVIGMAPLGMLLASQDISLDNWWAKLAAIAPIAVVIALWAPLRLETYEQSRSCGNMLAFTNISCSSKFTAYGQSALRNKGEILVRGWQAQVPEGATIMAWISLPFLLDYSRNEIFEVDEAGVSAPWALVPDAEYIIYQYKGDATRTPEQRDRGAKIGPKFVRSVFESSLRFMKYLNDTMVVTLIYRDDLVVVGKITPPENRDFRIIKEAP